MMNRLILRISAIAAAVTVSAFVCTELSGQDYVAPPVTVSKEKVKVDGKICYTHIVLEKQTLYSISKAYDVSIEDIYAFNPGLKENGLKKNSIIVIPSPEAAAGKAGKSLEQSGKREKNKVAAGSDDQQAAPMAEAGAQNAVIQPKDALIHTVRWYEDLESIAQKYGISAEAIYKVNKLKTKELKSRQKLIIPQGADAVAAENAVLADSVENTGNEVTDGSSSTETGAADVAGEMPGTEESIKVVSGKNRIDVAMLLPLKADGDKPNSGIFDFYCGAMLAARDLGMQGTNVNLDVHDISSENPQSFGKKFYKDNDIIIGPVSPSDIAAVLTASDKASYIVSPLDPKAASMLASNATLIQAPSSHKAQYSELVNWIADDLMPKDRLLVISEKSATTPANVKLLQKTIADSGLQRKEMSYSILEGRKIIDNLRALMSQEGTTRVVIASESEAFVNDVLRNLNLLIHESFDVVLYGQSKFRSFDTIEVENFHNTNMHVCLPYYINYDDTAVMEFIKKYRALFRTEPSQFAFQGYDVAGYFMQLCAEYGDAWPQMMPEARRDMLQASFDFSGNNDGSGYENRAVRRVVYGPDYSITVQAVRER